jgi:hypothetical protein
MADWSPLENEVYLKGTLTVIVLGSKGQPREGQRVTIRGCGFV